MPKKIIFLTCLVLFISNNLQTMYFPFFVGLVNEQDDQFDENSCCSCLRVSMAAICAVMFQSNGNQEAPLLEAQQEVALYAQQRRFASLMDSQFSIKQNKIHND